MPALLVLGPLEVRDPAGRRIGLSRRKQRALLALLLVRAGEVVRSDEIVDALWGKRPPTSARANLYLYVSDLRKTLASAAPSAGVRPRSHAQGYVLEPEAGEYDARVFEDLVGEGRRFLADGRPDSAAERLARALGLWRGAALEGLEDYDWLAPFTSRLEEERLTAFEDLVAARLALGQHGDLAVELSAATDQNPLRERLWGQLMTALHGAGHRTEALLAYDRMRAVFAAELGVEPTSTIRDLYQRIRGAGEVAPAQSMSPPESMSPPPESMSPPAVDKAGPTAPDRTVAVRERPAPAQLPVRPEMFTGRHTELTALSAALARPNAPGGTAVVIGMGGAGKTWLAVQWARENRELFPDGQLFVDLRGFHPSDQPMAPTTALRGFLDALGVAPGSIPSDADARLGLFRSLTSTRRMLLLLDNARDTEQVAGLLPGSDSCAVLVTSRHRLTGLVSRFGAQAVPLDVLDDDGARLLLDRRLTGQGLGLTGVDVDRIVGACGGLPLALAIAAARAAVLPGPAASAVVAELGDASVRLDALDEDDPHGGLRAVMSWSYAALDAAQARTFLLLGLLDLPDVGLPAVAALTGSALSQAAATLRALEQKSLLVQRQVGRWTMHDLVRLYAAERAAAVLSDDDRITALSHLVDHYLLTARAVDLVLVPSREPVPIDPDTDMTVSVTFPDAAAAWQWYESEHTGLAAVRRTATALGRHAAVWQLAWFTDTFYRRRGRLDDRIASWRDALRAAEHADDVGAQALSHRFLGAAHAFMGEHDTGLEHLQLALRLATQCDDLLSQAHTHRAVASAHGRAGRFEPAHEHSVQALLLYRRTGGQGQYLAHALNGVGWYAANLGRHDEARAALDEALTLVRGPEGEAFTESQVLDSLGYLFSRMGEHHRAVGYYRRAAVIARDLEDLFTAAETEERLGDSYAAMGDAAAARRHWEAAATTYRDQRRGHDCDRVLELIRNLPS